jgi:prepilin-type N-terminal cleavage/methylation domain-containing protein
MYRADFAASNEFEPFRPGPANCRNADRRAFALTELMVVIALLGILVALLLPAIQAARESSRGTSCRHNLKQIGLALINYESIHNCFPKGVEGRFPAMSAQPSYGFSWWIQILPNLEQSEIADQLDRSGSNVATCN